MGEAAKAAEAWMPKKQKINETDDNGKSSSGSTGGSPFKRVDVEKWATHAEQDGVADNSYENAFGSEGFGARSSEKLIMVRGKDFRHEKTKRKRSFNGFARTGGAISMNSNSIKYQFNSDLNPWYLN